VFGCSTCLWIPADKNYIPGQCAVCELRSYNGFAGLAAASSLWKYDTFPIYVAMMTMLNEIYINAH